MAARQNLEIGGCVLIAVALHLVIGGALSTGQSAMGANMSGPPPQLAAGSGSMQDLVNQWESPPETASEPEQQQPEELTQPELAQPEPDTMPETAPEAPVAPTAPQLSAAQPNLPEPPAPLPEDAVYPELRTFDPPVFRSALALEESVRPGPKPPKSEPRQQAAPEPEPRQQAQPPQQAQQQPARQPAQPGGGAGGNAQASRAGGGGGGGGASPQQQASALQQWGGQIQSCIASRAGRASGVRGRASVTISLNVASNGVIQGVGIASSSGNPAADQAALRAAQSAGRCPAAPAALTNSSYPFALPIQIR